MMIKIKLSTALLGIAILICSSAMGQISDNHLWTGAKLRFRMNKKLRFDIEEQVRFNNDVSKLNITFTEGSILYEFTKRISIKGNFRYTYDPESHNALRYSADFAYDWSKKRFPFDFKYRIRFQRQVEEHTRESDNYLRNKFSADYNLSRLVDPFIAYESYFKLDYINKFTVNRYVVGLEWRILKNLDLETFFMYENEFGERNPEINKVYGIGLTYDFEL